MKDFVLSFPVKPRGKGRPRFGRSRSGHPVAYTDQATRDYENKLMEMAGDQMVEQGVDAIEGAKYIVIWASFAKPKSWSKKKREAAIHHLQKPDADNIAKSVCDALEGVAFTGGDESICYLRVIKDWAEEDRITVQVGPYPFPGAADE